MPGDRSLESNRYVSRELMAFRLSNDSTPTMAGARS